MNKMQSGFLVCALWGLAACGCASSSAGMSQQDRQAEIDAVCGAIHAVIVADNNRDIDAVLSCYTDDVQWYPPDQANITGKDTIRGRYRLLFNHHEVAFTDTVEDVKLADGWATARGQIKGSLKPTDGGATIKVDDKFMAIVRQEGDTWRIAELIWNRNVPRN